MQTGLKKQDFVQIIGVALMVGALLTLTGCFEDNDTPLENAAEDVSEGFEDAADELDGEDSVGENIGEAVEDAGDEIQDMSQ